MNMTNSRQKTKCPERHVSFADDHGRPLCEVKIIKEHEENKEHQQPEPAPK